MHSPGALGTGMKLYARAPPSSGANDFAKPRQSSAARNVNAARVTDPWGLQGVEEHRQRCTRDMGSVPRHVANERDRLQPLPAASKVLSAGRVSAASSVLPRRFCRCRKQGMSARGRQKVMRPRGIHGSREVKDAADRVIPSSSAGMHLVCQRGARVATRKRSCGSRIHQLDKTAKGGRTSHASAQVRSCTIRLWTRGGGARDSVSLVVDGRVTWMMLARDRTSFP